jgi:uncharacterized protein YggE
MVCVTRSAVLMVLTAAQLSGQGFQTTPPRLTATGEGQVRVAPDRATVFIGVQTRGANAAGAASENARRQRAIIDTVKALGIPSTSISTQGYSVSPDIKYDNQTGAQKVNGYVVNNTVRVELSKIDQVGQVIDAGLAKGANEIGGVQFSLSNAVEARRAAIADAVRAARLDAEAMASAANGSVGPLIELSTSSPVYRPVFAASAMRTASTPTPIDAGEQVVTASVSAAWQFVPRPPSP